MFLQVPITYGWDILVKGLHFSPLSLGGARADCSKCPGTRDRNYLDTHDYNHFGIHDHGEAGDADAKSAHHERDALGVGKYQLRD